MRKKEVDAPPERIAKHALSVGELDTPDREMARRFASARFLRAVFALHPEALQDLAKCPLGRRGQLTKATEPWIRGWAARHRIPPTPVILAIVLDNASDWKSGVVNPSLTPWVLSVVPHAPEFPVAPLPPFNPVDETRSQWNARVARWTGELLAEYKRHGYRSPSFQLTRSHFNWLARRVVDGESINSIARSVKPSDIKPVRSGDSDDVLRYRQAVSSAVNRLARLIGVPRTHRKILID